MNYLSNFFNTTIQLNQPRLDYLKAVDKLILDESEDRV